MRYAKARYESEGVDKDPVSCSEGSGLLQLAKTGPRARKKGQPWFGRPKHLDKGSDAIHEIDFLIQKTFAELGQT
jgi:hypothetical protein